MLQRASRIVLAAALPGTLALAFLTGGGPAGAGTTLTLNPTSGTWSTPFTMTPGDGGQCASSTTLWQAYVVPQADTDSDADLLAHAQSVPPASSAVGFGGAPPPGDVIPPLDAEFANGLVFVTAGQWQIGILCIDASETIVDDWFTTITFDGSSSPDWSSASAAPSPVATGTVLSVSPPSPAADGSQQTLTAAVSAASGSAVPAGSVDFADGPTDLGSVSVDSSGSAVLPVSLADGSHSLTATFTPSDATAFSSSVSPAVPYTVSPPSSGGGGPAPGTEQVTVSVPSPGTVSPPADQLTLTVPSGAVPALTVSADGTTATGLLAPVSVADTRASSAGWTVSGQAGDFSGPAGSFSGDELGWAPQVTASTGAVTAGPAVAPEGPGLGTTAGVLGSSTGDSTATLGATLNLAIPSGQAAGTYTSTITITAI